MEAETLIVAGVMAASNLGGVGCLMAWYSKRIDKHDVVIGDHSVLLAQATENQRATAVTLATLTTSTRELYDSRNEHEKDLTKINELHEIKNCKTLFQGIPIGTRG